MPCTLNLFKSALFVIDVVAIETVRGTTIDTDYSSSTFSSGPMKYMN